MGSRLQAGCYRDGEKLRNLNRLKESNEVWVTEMRKEQAMPSGTLVWIKMMPLFEVGKAESGLALNAHLGRGQAGP